MDNQTPDMYTSLAKKYNTTVEIVKAACEAFAGNGSDLEAQLQRRFPNGGNMADYIKAAIELAAFDPVELGAEYARLVFAAETGLDRDGNPAQGNSRRENEIEAAFRAAGDDTLQQYVENLCEEIFGRRWIMENLRQAKTSGKLPSK